MVSQGETVIIAKVKPCGLALQLGVLPLSPLYSYTMHHHVRNAHAPISAATQEKAANTKAAIEEKYAQMRKVRRRKAEESAGPSISNCSPRRATSSTQQGMGMEWAGGHRSKGLLALACNCASHNPGASDPGPQTTRRFAARGSARGRRPHDPRARCHTTATQRPNHTPGPLPRGRSSPHLPWALVHGASVTSIFRRMCCSSSSVFTRWTRRSWRCGPSTGTRGRCPAAAAVVVAAVAGGGGAALILLGVAVQVPSRRRSRSSSLETSGSSGCAVTAPRTPSTPRRVPTGMLSHAG